MVTYFLLNFLYICFCVVCVLIRVLSILLLFVHLCIVIGLGLEQLIKQLAENDPNRSGTPHAAKLAVEVLLVVKIS